MEELNTEIKWQNRRRMAWLCLAMIVMSGLVITTAGLSSDAVLSRVERMDVVIGMWWSILSTPLLYYYSATALVNVRTGK